MRLWQVNFGGDPAYRPGFHLKILPVEAAYDARDIANNDV
jgi:hypothetical protein